MSDFIPCYAKSASKVKSLLKFWRMINRFLCCLILILFLIIFHITLFYFNEIKTDIPISIYSFLFIYLMLFIILSISYLLFNYIARFVLYSTTGYYIHAVTHLIRDYLAKLQRAFSNTLKKSISIDKNNELIDEKFDNIVLQCLDYIAEMFSNICETECSVCIKEINHDKSIVTLSRNTKSKNLRNEIDKANLNYTHILEGSSSFSSICYGNEPRQHNCFLCNDLIEMYLKGEYYNSTMEALGRKPKITTTLFNRRKIKNNDWDSVLPYKSAMIFPIRYFDKPQNPCNAIAFLCIDSPNKNTFDFQYQAELGATFADLFYIFFKEYQYILENYCLANKDLTK